MTRHANRVDASAAMNRAESSSMPTNPSAGHDSSPGDVLYVPLTAIVADPRQPRVHFEVDQLAASILAAGGILQPLLVRRPSDGESTYQLIDGERRLRALLELERN